MLERAWTAGCAAAPLVAPGRVLGLVGSPGLGLTRLGLTLLADPAHGAAVAFVDVRGWLSPLAAWEAGIPPEHLVVVRCSERDSWGRVTAALLEGLAAVYAEVPAGVGGGVLRRLGALARARRAMLILRPLSGSLPSGLAQLKLVAEGVRWEGADSGHGRIVRRLLTLRAAGKEVGGIERLYEVEDEGTDVVRVVSQLAATEAGRAVG